MQRRVAFTTPPGRFPGRPSRPESLSRKGQGPLVGTRGTTKGWLRIGVMDMEILIRRPILPGMALSRLDRFTCRWKGPDDSLVIGFSFSVGGSWRLGAADAIEDPKPYQHKETEDSTERATREGAPFRAWCGRSARRSGVAVAFRRRIFPARRDRHPGRHFSSSVPRRS
jgi:hypothetical protein